MTTPRHTCDQLGICQGRACPTCTSRAAEDHAPPPEDHCADPLSVLERACVIAIALVALLFAVSIVQALA